MVATQLPSADPRQRVLQAATELFLENGYRVGMDTVARRAGVAKQTVYAHFGSKEGLFRAAVGVLVQPVTDTLDAEPLGLEDALTALARLHCEHAGDERFIALDRMLIAEAPRFPKIARELYDGSYGAMLRRLSARLQRAMDAGELRRDEPVVAAELLLAMLNGLEPDRRLLGLEGRGPSAHDGWCRHAVQMFLRAYAPPSPDIPERKAP